MGLLFFSFHGTHPESHGEHQHHNTTAQPQPSQTKSGPTQSTNTKVISLAYSERNAYGYVFSQLMEREHASVRMCEQRSTTIVLEKLAVRKWQKWQKWVRNLLWTSREHAHDTNRSPSFVKAAASAHGECHCPSLACRPGRAVKPIKVSQGENKGNA